MDVTWEGGGVRDAVVRSSLGGLCRVRSDAPLRLAADAVPVRRPEPVVLEFDTAKGGEYRLLPR